MARAPPPSLGMPGTKLQTGLTSTLTPSPPPLTSALTMTSSQSHCLSPSDLTLRAEINRRLLESGELERLETMLLDLLRESGWYEDTKNLCHERLRTQDAKIGNFNALLSDVEKRVKDTVPEKVKVEVVKAIKKVLESMMEGS